MTAIREEQVLAALRELETTRWEEVLDFIDYLRQRGEAACQAGRQARPGKNAHRPRPGCVRIGRHLGGPHRSARLA